MHSALRDGLRCAGKQCAEIGRAVLLHWRPGGAMRAQPLTASGASWVSAADDGGSARPGFRWQAHGESPQILTPCARRFPDFPARCSARDAAPLPSCGASDLEARTAGYMTCWAEIPALRPASTPPEPLLPPEIHILPPSSTWRLYTLAENARVHAGGLRLAQCRPSCAPATKQCT